MENSIHPLIEMLNLEGYDTLSAPENLSLFTDLKKALVADRKPIKGQDGQQTVLIEALSISDAESLWQAQGEILMIMTSTYANNTLSSLFDAMNELSDGGYLFVEVDDLNHFNIPNLNDWLHGFNGDLEPLGVIRKSWSNVINLLNIATDLDELNN